jgi:hypothetical protein
MLISLSSPAFESLREITRPYYFYKKTTAIPQEKLDLTPGLKPAVESSPESCRMSSAEKVMFRAGKTILRFLISYIKRPTC